MLFLTCLPLVLISTKFAFAKSLECENPHSHSWKRLSKSETFFLSALLPSPPLSFLLWRKGREGVFTICCLLPWFKYMWILAKFCFWKSIKWFVCLWFFVYNKWTVMQGFLAFDRLWTAYTIGCFWQQGYFVSDATTTTTTCLLHLWRAAWFLVMIPRDMQLPFCPNFWEPT